MLLAGALGLIVISALRFTIIASQSVHEAIFTVYYLMFGVVLALCQLNIKFMNRNFRFI